MSADAENVKTGNDTPLSLPPKIRRLAISTIRVGQRIRKDVGDLAELAALLRHKQLQPIGVRPAAPGDYSAGFILVFGQRRLAAAKLNGWEMIDALVFDDLADALAALRAELSENRGRKDFTPTELVEAYRQLAELEKPAAAEREAAGLVQNRLENTAGANCPSGGGRVRERVAEVLGVGARTLGKAVAVADAAEAEPDRYGDLLGKMDEVSVNAAHQEMEVRKYAPQLADAVRDGRLDVGTAAKASILSPLELAALATTKDIKKAAERAIEEKRRKVTHPKPRPALKKSAEPKLQRVAAADVADGRKLVEDARRYVKDAASLIHKLASGPLGGHCEVKFTTADFENALHGLKQLDDQLGALPTFSTNAEDVP